MGSLIFDCWFRRLHADMEGSEEYHTKPLELRLMIKKILTGFVLLGVLLATAGCNTVRGIGLDLTEAGDAIVDATGGNP